MLEKNSSVQLNRNSEIRRQKRTKVFFVCVLFFLVIIVGVIGFLRRREFQINAITVVNTHALDPVQIESVVRKSISGNYVLVIPRTNALFFSKTKTARLLLEQFSGLQDVSINFTDRNHITVTVDEKRPSYVWCRSGSCWFVDHDGIIYDQSAQFSDGVFTLFSGTDSGNDLPDDPRRGRFVSAAGFEQIQSILDFLTTAAVHPLEISYLTTAPFLDAQATGPGDIAIRIDTLKNNPVASTAVILITNKTTVETLAQSLDLLMNEGKFVDQLKSDGNSLQYVDLRFAGKIYYKFKQAAVVTPSKNATR